MTVTEKIEAYIVKSHGGRVDGVYGSSLSGSFVGLLIQRRHIHIDHGFIGSSDLDQDSPIVARLLTMLVGPMFSGAYKSESRREKLKAKLQKNTPLEDDIYVNGTMVRIVYALKMGEKYRKRYRRHFRNPDIHEFDTVPRLKSLI